MEFLEPHPNISLGGLSKNRLTRTPARSKLKMSQINPQLAALLRQLQAKLSEMEQRVLKVEAIGTYEDEIEAIPGRRVFHTLVATQTFTASQDGGEGASMTFTVSQDGPFVLTHYPIAGWRASAPSSATDFGMWRPITTWPLPDQVLDNDIIDISYRMSDDGSQRNFQNENSVPGLLLSNPDNLIELPKHTYFRPNSVISFIPVYNNIAFGGSTPTTQGTLVVALPGYKIVNLG